MYLFIFILRLCQHFSKDKDRQTDRASYCAWGNDPLSVFIFPKWPFNWFCDKQITNKALSGLEAFCQRPADGVDGDSKPMQAYILILHVFLCFFFCFCQVWGHYRTHPVRKKMYDKLDAGWSLSLGLSSYLFFNIILWEIVLDNCSVWNSV